jgi:hypothetical protein
LSFSIVKIEFTIQDKRSDVVKCSVNQSSVLTRFVNPKRKEALMKSTRRGRELLPKWVIGGVLLVLSLLAFNPSAKAAVTGKIAGVVVNAQTGEPLPGANVIIEGTAMGAAANPDGYFFIIRVSPGVYNVQARMMGYESVTQTGVEVTADHTTRLKFALRPTVVPGEGVTVRAEAEVIKMDLSSSAISAKSDDIEAVPFVDDIGDYINRQAGIQNWNVRGGSIDEVGFMTDGLSLVDGRTNSPALMPPLSMIKELNVIKGGFAAEYGNLRSGLINIVTKEPSDEYHGSINYRFSPAHLKHGGVTVYDPEHYWLRAYLSEEDSLCWIGNRGIIRKRNAAEDSAEALDLDAGDAGDSALYEEYMELYNHYLYVLEHNKSFDGWISVAEDDSLLTPEQARDRFMWTHRAEGADSLVPEGYDGPPRVGKYGDKPDWSIDASFGGPVPVIGGFLGDLGFYVSHRQNREAFALPSSRDYYIEENTMLKLVSHITQSIKLSYDMMYGEQNTLSASSNGELGAEGSPQYLNFQAGDLGAQFVDFVQGTGYVSGAGGIYLSSGDDVFRSEVVTKHAAYYPAFTPWYDVYHNMQGITFDHALSERTFYTVRISHLTNERRCKAYETFEPRDTSVSYTLQSGVEVGEIPYGYYLNGALVQPDQTWMGAHCAGAVDTSKSQTWDFKIDLTNQLNPYNEVKVGFEYNYADMSTYYEKNRWESTHENWVVDWEANPIRGGAYIQDKIEFEGIIATIGLRADWNDPNTDWFNLGTYEYYFTRLAKENLGKEGLLEQGATHPAEGHLKIAPRIGISHPISENAKLYFNYGDFYSLPASYNMYQIFWGPQRFGITYLGDPELEWPLTRAYELGTDWNIGDMFRIHLAGYYKDITSQLEAVEYIGYDESPDYSKPENLNYEDIRGIDFRISKDFGDWFRGWLNYDYRVRSYGQTGKQTHYQNLLDEATSGAWDTLEYAPRAQPILQANIQFMTPEDLGILFGSINLSFNYTWEAGRYQTFDPLDREITDPTRPYLNVQWKPWRNVQARIQKGIAIAGTNISVFAEVNNLFDWKYLDTSSGCFVDDQDEDQYYHSLKLPLYEEEAYQDLGEAGDDQFGDVSSEDKSYIDDPELTHLAFHNPRSFVFGVKVDF